MQSASATECQTLDRSATVGPPAREAPAHGELVGEALTAVSGRTPGSGDRAAVVSARSPQAQGEQPGLAQARRLWLAALLVLSPVAGIGAVLSFDTLYAAAQVTFGRRLALGFPLLVDMLILGSSLAFLAGASVGRARAGWRWTAHAGVGGTLTLNALAAASPAAIPWHVTPPLVWSVLVEMTARQVTGEWQAAHATAPEQIPARLWMGSPVGTARTWWFMARTGERHHSQACAALAVQEAALAVLRLALPGYAQRDVRRILRRQLRAGSLSPAALLRSLGGVASGMTAEHRARLELMRSVAIMVTRPPAGDAADGPSTGRPPAGTPGQAGTVQVLDPGAATVLHAQVRAEPLPGTPEPTTAVTPAHLRTRRQALTARIIESTPDISGPQLARQLSQAGWKVSDRTASRLLSEARAGLDHS
jgi:hypothetical protein